MEGGPEPLTQPKDKNSLAGTWDSGVIRQMGAPLRAQVLKMLREAILNYDLKPGQKLVERELMENLGVSRTTVREALRELTAEGLVMVFQHRGSFVSKPSLEDARDLYEVRAILESVVVTRFIERATNIEIKQLAKTVTELEKITNTSAEIREILSAKDKFYAVLVLGARSPALKQILEGIQARVQVLRATSLSKPGRQKETIKELRDIVAAIKKKNVKTAAYLSSDHIRKASITALALLAETENYVTMFKKEKSKKLSETTKTRGPKWN